LPLLGEKEAVGAKNSGCLRTYLKLISRQSS
jgi:hypothetical protein